MQHGTGRERIVELVENVIAALDREVYYGRPYGDLVGALRTALITFSDDDLDTPGVYGPDYGFEPRKPRTLNVSGVSDTTTGRINER